MAVKDRDMFYEGLRSGGALVPTPNTVSRSMLVGERAFQTVVAQSGKAVLDSELLLGQEAAKWAAQQLRRWQIPSGWLRGRTRADARCDYTMETAPALTDDSPLGIVNLITGAMVNGFALPRLEACVAGMPLVVEYTNTRTEGYNLIALETPQIYDGTSGTFKRTDFVFLEVWMALVAPSPKAQGTVQVVSAADVTAGDVININGFPLTAIAVGPVVGDQFLIDAGSAANTAASIALTINTSATFNTTVTARRYTDTVLIEAVSGGVWGNAIGLGVVVAVPGAMVVSGATLINGEDRENKPASAQNMLYRHGNVQSPAPVWLPDEILDTVVNRETSQRVQLQYRIRVTGTNEGVNYKKHPDGFSTVLAGPAPGIYAQAGRVSPVTGYPFVPADLTTTWLSSSATAYGQEDGGLWIAGDGTEQAAKDLGALDGFVYAIPICFLFRHNDSYSAAPGFQGFDPVTNANGAPTYGHDPYAGPVGNIPAGSSDRPDGHWCDVLTLENLLDLRRHVAFTDQAAPSELLYQIQSLMDGNNLTWAIDTADKQHLGGASGDVSVKHFVCNEVGRGYESDPIDPAGLVGNTTRGVTIRQFDHIARRFGDQSIVERVVFSFYPTDIPGVIPGKYVTKVNPLNNYWFEGDILTLDLTLFDATTLSGIFQGLDGDGPSLGVGPTDVATFAPLFTCITDVLSIYHDEGHYITAVDQTTQATTITGLGTRQIQITLDANDAVVNGGMAFVGDYLMVGNAIAGDVGSDRRIFVEVEITYPIGVGLTDTPDMSVVPDPLVYVGDGTPIVWAGPGPVIENDLTQRPNDLDSLKPPQFRSGYREVLLEEISDDTVIHAGVRSYQMPVGSVNQETLVSRDRTSLYFPRRVYGAVAGPYAGGTTVVDVDTLTPSTTDDANTEYGSSSRKVMVTLPTQLPGLGQTRCYITYFPQDPIPNYGPLGGGYQLSVYFRSNAPQTAGTKEGNILSTVDGVLPTTLLVEPVQLGSDAWTGQVGKGSQDLGYPYESPLEQIPINDGGFDTIREWYLCANANVTVDDFSASTGLLALHPFVQADGQSILQFGGAGVTESPRKDAEFRAYYPFADDLQYRPTIMAQPLYGATRHKVFFPFLARIVEEVPGFDGGGRLFRKDELALVVLSRFAYLDDENNIRFTDSDNLTCAALYRTRNMLLLATAPESPCVPSVTPAPWSPPH
jgi:hypothetical protein